MEITKQQLYEAYRKLKNNFYYDNTTLFVKQQIAEFEEQVNAEEGEDFREKFDVHTEMLRSVLNGQDDSNALLNSFMGKIKCRLIPKKLYDEHSVEKNESTFIFISNTVAKKKIRIEQVNALIEAPVELHLISVLWVMLVGGKLSAAISANNYAYQLNFKNDSKEIRHGFHLYKPYYHGYQQWRDNAHNTAQHLLDEKKNATFISLDIQRYFYSIRANVQELCDQIIDANKQELSIDNDLYKRLNALLQSIHEKYAEIVGRHIEEAKSSDAGKVPFPVGLLSSGLLGNLYLSDFDKAVTEKLTPVYYGRYVDDMLFVFANISIKDAEEAQAFIDEIFCGKAEVLNKTDGKKYVVRLHEELKIQAEKLLIQHFDHKGSRAALDKFMHNIQRQRSEFRFLPSEDIVEKNFEDAAFTIQYSGSINKLRSMQDLKEDKYGASTYLSQLIMLARYWGKDDRKRLQKACKQILSFFNGRTAITHYALWEKVATFLIITRCKTEFKSFCKNVLAAIGNIEWEKDGNDVLKSNLIQHLYNSIALPLSLNLTFDISMPKEKWNKDEMHQQARSIRKSLMFRHSLMGFRFLLLTKFTDNTDINLFDSDISKFCSDETAGFKDVKNRRFFMPCFIHFNVFNLLLLVLTLRSEKQTNNEEVIIRESKRLFTLFNYSWFIVGEGDGTDHIDIVCLSDDAKGERLCKKIYVSINGQKGETTEEGVTERKQRIAIANIKVSEDSIRKMAKGDFSINHTVTTQLTSVINTAVMEKCKMLILPELSVPFNWVQGLVSRCIHDDITFVAGLTHFACHGVAYNMVVTILPVKIGTYTTCAIIGRIKNHYAPLEVKVINSYGFKVQKLSPSTYFHFHWRQLYFTVYNCFELASIEDRSLFKSEVDLVVATECNKDTHYYSDIVGSWVRDLHCYLAQVNTSNYGDSRIMQPSKSVTRDLVIVKGGKNSTILVEDLDVKALRDYQLKGHLLQMDDAAFKLTPPNYESQNVLKRMEDQELF